MANVLGIETGLNLPSFSLTGMFSNTWVYVLLVVILGIIICGVLALFLFKRTYNKRIVIFENISGRGYQPTLKTSARVIRLEKGGMEVLKTLGGAIYLDAYGRKMGNNTYWFAKGSDGYYYNIVLGDLDTKMGMLDIEPIDRDVRMYHAGIDKLREMTYNKKSWFEEHANQLILFGFLIVLILGIWFIVGKVGDATKALAATAEVNKAVLEALNNVLRSADNIKTSGGITGGLIPA